MHSSEHGPLVVVYGRLVCKGISIEFSCVTLIQGLFLSPTLRNKFITAKVILTSLHY